MLFILNRKTFGHFERESISFGQRRNSRSNQAIAEISDRKKEKIKGKFGDLIVHALVGKDSLLFQFALVKDRI